MKLKIIAQRKFAQGIPAPSSNSTTNTTVEKKTADVTKDLSNVFHNNTSATKLLDLVSFDGIHTHNPYVRVERLRNITENKLNLIMETSSTRDISPTSRSLESRYRQSRKMSLSQKMETMVLRSGAKINNTAKKSTAKGVSKSHLSIKKRRNPTRKAAFIASFYWKLIPSDTEFSVDDDKPLAHLTRTANQKMSNQTQEGSSSKNYNKSGPISKEHGNLRISVDEGSKSVRKLPPAWKTVQLKRAGENSTALLDV